VTAPARIGYISGSDQDEAPFEFDRILPTDVSMVPATVRHPIAHAKVGNVDAALVGIDDVAAEARRAQSRCDRRLLRPALRFEAAGL
jgi:hypothetical protein